MTAPKTCLFATLFTIALLAIAWSVMYAPACSAGDAEARVGNMTFAGCRAR